MDPVRNTAATIGEGRAIYGAVFHAFASEGEGEGGAGDASSKSSLDEPIRLFAYGTNVFTFGTFTLDKAGAIEALERFAAYGNDLVFDYEHQTFGATGNGPVPASGWIRQGALEMRDDGIYAKVEWTERARELIAKREYRYYSPSWYADAKGRINEILPPGLVNFPGTVGMSALAAKHAKARDLRANSAAALSFGEVSESLQRALYRLFRDSDTYAYIVEVYDDACVFRTSDRLWRVAYHLEGTQAVIDGDAVEVQRTYSEVEGEQKMSMKLVKTALRLSESATDEEAVRHVASHQSLAEDAVRLTNAKSVDEARGALTALVAKAARADAAEAELEAIKAKAVGTEEDALLDKAVEELKVTPAERIELAARPGSKTEAGVKWLAGYLSKLTPRVRSAKEGAASTGGKGSADSSDLPELTPREKRLAKDMGVSEERARKSKAALRNASRRDEEGDDE